jgi:nucleoside-diphosphate-sugar epimerase
MSVVVTGSNGFIGSAVARCLLERGALDVRCLVRVGSDLRRLDPLVALYPGRARIVVGSLTSVTSATAAIGDADEVIHLAAGLQGAPAEIFASTVVTSARLLDAARARVAPPKIVLVSSFSVYGVAELDRGAVVDEQTPLEAKPVERDAYAFAKIWQERMFWEAANRIPLVVVRPGMVYGPGGSAMSNRVGIQLGGLFLHLGGDNALPLTYVDNCAEAIVLASAQRGAVGEVYNVVDDDAVAASHFLRRYQKEVQPLRALRIPYPALMFGSRLLERYNRHSHGQLPAVFTPYKTASLWKSQRFDNSKLKKLGWKPTISSAEGISRTFASLRADAG